MNGYHDLESIADYGSDYDHKEKGETHSPPVIEYTLDKGNEDQHAQCHDFKNTVVYHCHQCGDLYASRNEPESIPRCLNCRIDRDKLPDNVLVDGFSGMHPLFCCPTCNHHWIMKGGVTSRCKMCQNNNLVPPLIKPSMFGVGWMISRFLGRSSTVPFQPRHIPSYSSSSSSYVSRRPSGPPYPARSTPPKVCFGSYKFLPPA